MNRPYRSEAYLQRVQAMRRAFPDAAIGADVIVGFPGETDEEFAQTLALVEAAPLTYLHVFGYSDRPGTRASAMTDKVPPEVIAGAERAPAVARRAEGPRVPGSLPGSRLSRPGAQRERGGRPAGGAHRQLPGGPGGGRRRAEELLRRACGRCVAAPTGAGRAWWPDAPGAAAGE